MIDRRRHPALFWLLAAALLAVKAFVPSGWMPVASEGGVRIALCTGAGTTMATLDPQGRLHRDGAPESPVQEACPYATAATPFVLASPPMLAAAPLLVAMAEPAAPVAALIAARRALRPPARGPPAFA